MFFKKKEPKVNALYNKIVELSRIQYLYKDLNISDNINSRINLIFFHTSFIITKFKKEKTQNHIYSQSLFDYIFNQIEFNFREIGQGDVTVNKNMKNLVKTFYNILLKCEKFEKMSVEQKKDLLSEYFSNNTENTLNIDDLIVYFEKFRLFCINLSLNLIEKGDIKFEIN